MTRRAGRFTFGSDDVYGRSYRGPVIVALVLAVAGALAYWYFNPQAQPSLLSDYLPSAPSAEVTLYRWRDENDHWVLSDQPPPEGVDYEEVRVRQDANVLPATNED